MWAARDIRYGGLNNRYKEKKGRLIRLIDPFTAKPVEFSTTLRADNWLVRNFCPGVVSCVVQPDTLRFMEKGVIHRTKCDTLTTFSDGTRLAELVITELKSPSPEAWQILQKASVIHKLSVRLRTRDEIRANLTLLENLDMMRQHLVLHTDRGIEEVKKVVRNFVNQQVQPLSPVDVALELANRNFSKESTDSALFRLYREGVLSINLEEIPYGYASRIASA